MIFQTFVHIPTWGSANLIELAWTFGGLVGLVFTLPSFCDAIKDYRRITSVRENSQLQMARAVQARLAITGAALRLLTVAIVISIGVIACLQTSPQNVLLVDPSSLAIISGLLLVPILEAMKAVVERYRRLRLKEIARRLVREEKGL